METPTKEQHFTNVCCHYCRISRNRKRKKFVPYVSCNFCQNVFCSNCVMNHLKLDFETIVADPQWKCKPCYDECCCCKEECTENHRHCFTYIRTLKRYNIAEGWERDRQIYSINNNIEVDHNMYGNITFSQSKILSPYPKRDIYQNYNNITTVNKPFTFDTYPPPSQYPLVNHSHDLQGNSKHISALIKKNVSSPFLHLNQNNENIINQWDSNYPILYEPNQKNISPFISSNNMNYQPPSGNYTFRSNIISNNNNNNNHNIQLQDHQYPFLQQKTTLKEPLKDSSDPKI